MLFREGNRARWVGVRPGHNGTQIAKNNQAQNNVVIVHTVTTGKTFFLDYWQMLTVGNGANQWGVLYVRDELDVNQYNIVYQRLADIFTVHGECSLTYPYEIPADYDLCLTSNNANCISAVNIKGWEE